MTAIDPYTWPEDVENADAVLESDFEKEVKQLNALKQYFRSAYSATPGSVATGPAPVHTGNVVTVIRYSPDQPRDEHGRWSGGGEVLSDTGTSAEIGTNQVPAARMAANAALTGEQALTKIAAMQGNYVEQAAKLDMAKQAAAIAMSEAGDLYRAADQNYPTGDEALASPEWQSFLQAEETWAQAVEARNALEQQAPTTENIREQVIYQNNGSSALRARIDFSLDAKTMQTALAGSKDFERMVDPSLLAGDKGPRIVADTSTSLTMAGRSSYTVGQATVNLTAGARAESVVHELGHYLEDTNPQIQESRRDFVEERTAANEKPQSLNSLTGRTDFAPEEQARPDKFELPYTGKVYDQWYPKGNVSEVISTGMQQMYANPARMARNDPGFFKFIYDTVRTKRP